jgi:hypothetical protein
MALKGINTPSLYIDQTQTEKQDRRKTQSQKLITSLSLFIFILNNPTIKSLIRSYTLFIKIPSEVAFVQILLT